MSIVMGNVIQQSVDTMLSIQCVVPCFPLMIEMGLWYVQIHGHADGKEPGLVPVTDTVLLYATPDAMGSRVCYEYYIMLMQGVPSISINNAVEVKHILLSFEHFNAQSP
ncbi:hypothetical protein AKJ16_DCAP01774 [Drosera capensis]